MNVTDWVVQYIKLADEMCEAWNSLPAVVDDDFPAMRMKFEAASRAFHEHGHSPDAVSEFQQEHGKWADDTFGKRPVTGPLKHLLKEVEEVLDNPHDLEEYADCFLLLINAAYIQGFSFGDIFQAGRMKHLKNQKRQWGKVNDEGFSEHVRG